MLIDAHTHLDHSDRDADGQIADALAAGVGLIIQSGTDLESSRHALGLSRQYPQVFCSVGYHPQEAGLMTAEDLAGLAELTPDPRVVAVGETGFDFFHDNWPHDVQEQTFVSLLGLARSAGLPVVIHTRDAAERTLAVLDEHAHGLTVILHCFSLPAQLDEVLARGHYLSFAGNVTYKSATDLQEAARNAPPEKILLETDAPYLTPVPFRGRPNHPALVANTYAFVAALRATTVDELAAQVEVNVRRAYPRLDAALAGGQGR